MGSMVTYSNEAKKEVLGVKDESLKEHGAVSKKVVEEMANGVRKKLNADYGIATSGIAGPDGGTPEKPVGTVWVAISGPQKTISKVLNLGRSRERNIRISTLTVLNWLRREIISGTFE